MDAPLPARLPLEVLDRVRHVDSAAVDAGCLERLVEELARRSDERLAGAILLVAGLLTDEHHGRLARALSEHRVGPDLPEVTASAAGGSFPQSREREARRKE